MLPPMIFAALSNAGSSSMIFAALRDAGSSSLLALLQAAPAAPSISSSLPSIATFAVMIAIFYFLIFMPMRRQQKNTREMIKALQTGQTVLTSGGIIGTIVAVNDDTLILRIKPDNLKIQVARSAVTSLITGDDAPKK